MSRTNKLLLDIAMGAVIPILILNYLTDDLGAVNAYVLSALVPVAWVFIDLLFITKRFNFITSYVGLSAIVRGLLAFWYVDGVLFALKDSAGFVVAVLVFGGSILFGYPIMRAFLVQSLNPDTTDKEASLNELLRERPVYRALVWGTIIVSLVSAMAGLVNFYLNLAIVTASFGTDLFNQQVARVNAITRIALTIPDMLAFGVAFWLLYRALFALLPKEEGKDQFESDFWELMRLREAQLPSEAGVSQTSAPQT
jgi:hypothetical protein